MWPKVEDIFKPDERFAHMVRGFDPRTGPNFVTIQDMYGDVEPFTLGDAVPEQVRTQFDIGRKAYVYSWFEYELMTLAEMRALGSFELAIRTRARIESSGLPRKATLKPAVDHARKMGWLNDEDFGFIWNGAVEFPFMDAMVMQRNHLMHGNPYLSQHGTLMAFKFCFDAIQKLFPAGAAP
jgi:hypothetical protein